VTFRILAKQMRALGRQTQASFLTRMDAYLRKNLPEHVTSVGSERLAGWLAGALALAHASDIHTEPEAAQLMLLLTNLGLDADRKHDWVRDALEDRTLIPSGKITKLVVEGCRRVPELDELVVYPAYRDAIARANDPAEVQA
jgi:hypothetical protein